MSLVRQVETRTGSGGPSGVAYEGPGSVGWRVSASPPPPGGVAQPQPRQPGD